MLLRKLEHYNIRTTRHLETLRFYVDVLGMKRHDVMMNWLLDGSGTPAVHLTFVDPADPINAYAETSKYRGGARVAAGQDAFSGSGAIDHVAFECTDYEQVVSSLERSGVSYHATRVEAMNLRQIFVSDPNGITLELNFAGRS